MNIPVGTLILEQDADFPLIFPGDSVVGGVPFSSEFIKQNKDAEWWLNQGNNQFFFDDIGDGIDGEITLQLPRPQDQTEIQDGGATTTENITLLVAFLVIAGGLFLKRKI